MNSNKSLAQQKKLIITLLLCELYTIFFSLEEIISSISFQNNDKYLISNFVQK